jgi:hypothetical protein
MNVKIGMMLWRTASGISRAMKRRRTSDDLDDDLHSDVSLLELCGVLDLLNQSQDGTQDLLLQIVDTLFDMLSLGE